ncbi:MAG UNVERIFIED_CONTAM: hypothetical protein LVR29_05290 [Microcystis novacekii LVE1205-3]
MPLLIPGIEPELYIGTSPRTRLVQTRYVSTASEIPAPLIIPLAARERKKKTKNK